MSAVAPSHSPVSDGADHAGRARRLIGSPPAWVGVALGLAVLSWVLLPTVPSYDPYSWIIWGREVSDPHLAFTIDNGPSFKPLPFAFTVVYGLFGGAAPTLWLITARAGALLGLLGAARLAARLTRGGAAAAGVAGAIAVAGILTTQDWGYYFFRGASEPMLIGATAWAIDRMLAGRRATAFWLVVAAGLIRPEAWSFLILGGLWLGLRDPGWRGPGRRALLIGAVALIAVGWFGPPWLGSGNPLLAAVHAHEYDGQLGPDPFRAIVGRAVDDQVWPLLLAAAGLVVIRGVGGRDRIVLALGAFVAAWWLEVIVMTLLGGFPGLERFFLPAATVVCVLGAVGLVAVARWVGERVGRGGRPGRRETGTVRIGRGGRAPRAVAGMALAGLLAVSALAARSPISLLAQSEGQAALAARTLGGLRRAVAAAGGRERILPCPGSFVAVNHAAQPALAWDLGVPLEHVGTAMSDQGLDFIGPANVATGIPAAIDPRLLSVRPIAHVGRWYVLRLTDPHNPHGAPCAGS